MQCHGKVAVTAASAVYFAGWLSQLLFTYGMDRVLYRHDYNKIYTRHETSSGQSGNTRFTTTLCEMVWVRYDESISHG